MKYAIFIFLTIVFSIGANGQQRYQIQELGSNTPIPFVKVYPNSGTPFLSDLDGWISVDSSVTELRLSYAEYRDTAYRLSSVSGSILHMSLRTVEVEEVVVVAGENPAHRIIRQVIDRRKDNHPLKNDAFTYKSYSKFKFDLNPEALNAIPDSTTDTTLISMRDFFGKQHLFMMESTSKRTFIPPYRDKEEIIAYKVSGISDPMFSTFANSFQSFSFYENQFDLFGKQYVNPIARGGIDRYLFILEDTTIVNVDTTFTIFYRPKKGKIFDGLTGRLYINTKGYAIEKVIAEPYNDTTGIILRIVQEYSFENGIKWFPSKLTTELDMVDLKATQKIESSYMIGRGSMYIDDVQINSEIDKRGMNDNVSVETAEDAGEIEDPEWEKLRKYGITDKETETYRVIDSIGEAMNFNRWLRVLKILSEGKVPLGKYINLDLQRTLIFSNYEGFRLGTGLETSTKLMKSLQFGGNFGWGTRDNDWKYGGFSTIHLNRKKGIRLDLRYQQDIIERGGHSFHVSSALLSNSLYRQLFINQMDRQRLGELLFSWDLKSNIELKFYGNYQRIWLTQGYSYSKLSASDFDLAESGIELTWNILQKSMILGSQKVPIGKKYPQVRFKAAKGWKGLFESDFDYIRLNAEMSHITRMGTIGKLHWKIAAAKVVGDVPLTLSHVGIGTNQFWNISVENSFETMLAGEFYTTDQVSVFTRFMFRTIPTKAKWNQPRFGLHHAMGFGSFANREDHSWTFKSMDKGYFEAGFIFDGMLTTSTLSMGLGAFYRYGFYSSADWKQNIVPKIVFSFLID